MWPIVRPFLERSYAKANQDIPETVLDDLRADRRRLWVVVVGSDEIIAAGTTALYQMKTGKMCKIEHFGGMGMNFWLDQLAVIEQYAREQGCDRVMFEGRRGWGRKLVDYQQTAVILEKRL